MQRAARQPEPPQDYPSSVHPLQRYAAQHAVPSADHHQQAPFPHYDEQTDPSRYDDALYGQLDTGAPPEPQHDPEYAADPYGYQDGYAEGAEEQVQKRRGGMTTVAVVLALSVVGVGAAFAYRSYMGSPRSGDPPIIRADSSPTKIMPAQTDGTSKVPDRLGTGDGTEKIVPREEAPMDVNARSASQSGGPRVIFPPLNANNNPPSMASLSTSAPPPSSAGNGTMPNSEPRKIRTLSVRGDQPDDAALPVTSAAPPTTAPATKPALAPKGAATAQRSPPAPLSPSGNAPMSLVPQSIQAAPAVEPRTRVATTAPVQIAPAPSAASASSGGGYLVQVSSQRSENDAQASFRSLQGKFPSVLASRSPLIKRADLGDKGVYYRAMVGPFGSPEEASQFCGNLKSAGGQCVVQRN
jgi:hypothetical protein